jgi:hypothetical protein
MSVLEKLQEHIDGLTIIDTHEHLPGWERDRPPNADVLSEWLIHYFPCDLVSAGLSDEGLSRARDPGGDLMRRWELVEPFWRAARNTGYGRALDLAAKGVYGIDGVRRETIGELDRRFRAARSRGGHYRRVLKELSRIAMSVYIGEPEADPEFFRASFSFHEYVMPAHRRDLVAKEQRFGIRVHTLRDWKAVMEKHIDEALSKGAVALKCALAYHRPLRFAKVPEAEAERAFHELFSEAHSPDWRAPIKLPLAFQDHMVHHALALADARGLTVQFHTGIQEGTGNVVSDSNPTLLTNLFLEYRNVRFDLFHMGYPYVMEISNLAKNFRNVHIDMCWGHIISPEAARRALVEWLDAVPANKISAFGGDYCFVDGVYGHQLLARRNVAESLAQKVRDDAMDLDRAREVATWLFVDNPGRLFGLS